MVNEFVSFLKQYGVIGLAIAVIIGGKFNELLKAFVDGLLMPIVGALTPSGDWRQLILELGPVKIQVGLMLGSLVDFVIVAGLVFLIAKKVLKEETVQKR
ncbi:MAG: MscL family protein [Gemmatimonadetes bacterium]|jgi:large conductance mechanosensitive channel|nr:MscL family protein [Gemmatimonadota bacterium]